MTWSMLECFGPRLRTGDFSKRNEPSCRPGGYVYLFVVVFSLAGLAKWKFQTQYKLKWGILVCTRSHRFRQGNLNSLIQRAGLRVVREDPRSIPKKLFAASRRHAILARKRMI